MVNFISNMTKKESTEYINYLTDRLYKIEEISNSLVDYVYSVPCNLRARMFLQPLLTKFNEYKKLTKESPLKHL